MSVQVYGQAILTVLETLTAGVADVFAGNAVVTHSKFNVGFNLNSTTTPAAQKVASFSKAMVGGAGTIDLTALPGTNGAIIDGTGLVVIGFLVTNPSNNIILVGQGASNPYPVWGSSMVSLRIQKGGTILQYESNGNGFGVAISSSNKNINIAGSGTDSLNVVIVLG